MTFSNIVQINQRAREKAQQLENLFNLQPSQESAGTIVITQPTVDPFDFQQVGGVMGDCAQWIYESSRSPIQEFSVAAAIATTSVIFGRRAVGPTGAGLNVYIVMVAPTGFGKDWPLNGPAIITREVGTFGRSLIGPTNVTGDSAIERALRESPCLVMPIDEFGLILQGATNRNAPAWTQTINRALLELYSRSAPHGTWIAKALAHKKKGADDSPIEQPTLSILGATTPEEFYKGLTTSSTSNGLLNRLVVVAVTERPELRDLEGISIFPKALAERLSLATTNFPTIGNLSSVASSSLRAIPRTVPFANDEARQRFKLVQEDQRRMLDSETDLAGLAERVAENTIKLATLRAISRQPTNPAVTFEDIEWSWAFVHQSIDCVSNGVARYMSGSKAEALWKLVLGHIRDASATGIHKSTLMRRRRVGEATHYELEQAIQWLEKSGQIAQIGNVDGKGGRGRSGEKYVAVEHHQIAA
jgi:Protein of unknown function (DUF3987)